MKKSINLSIFPAPGSGIGKSLFTMLSFLITTVLMISCRKEVGEKMDPASVADTTGIGNNVSASAVNTYYLSPTGNDNNSGTISAPFKTLNKAWEVIASGDLVYLRGGTYSWTSSQYLEGKNGTSGNLIKIWAYPGEVPILTSGSNYSGNDLIEWTGNYIHWKGLEITNFKGNSSFSAFRSENCNNCIFELINYHHNPLGFTIRNCNNNLILNSDFHHNEDGAGDNADGLNITYISNGSYTNTVRGCRAWNNSDDGFDYWANDGNVLTENSWSWHNGYAQNESTPRGDGSGFKMGEYMGGTTTTLKRTLRNCIAANNRLWGFNENHTLARIDMYNNTAYNNGNQSFWFGDWGSHVMNVRNNIHYVAPQGYTLSGSGIVADHNSWQNGISVSNADFVSLDATQLLRVRKTDGSLPDITFLQLAAGSDLVNTGVNVGLPFNSSAPDIGAFESGGTATPPANQAPVANAGADKNITLPVNSTSLTGSGTDPDGTIASYSWSRTSGPNTPVLSGTSTAALSASNLVAGTYVFRLTVTDNGGLTAFDEVNVVVVSTTPPANQPPVANAGTDKNITLPVNSVSITGSGTDPNGTIASYAWTRISGPNTPALSGTNTTTMSASNLVAGTYVFRLTVTDNGGLTGFDQVNVVVSTSTTNPPPNQAPVANAGADKTITLPVNSVLLTGSGTDPGGLITSYAWTRRSGPNTPVLSGSSTPTLSASNLIAGSYIFRLTVTDNGGLTAYDQVKVTVNASTTPPPTSLINTSQAVYETGFAYFIVQDFGTLADDNSNPTRSKLRIFENGVELNPAHTVHSDVENLGNGRFSHWADGSFVFLYFSASDNSNPKTNGRTYTYSITP